MQISFSPRCASSRLRLVSHCYCSPLKPYLGVSARKTKIHGLETIRAKNMALPMFRGCCRLSVSLGLNRVCSVERLFLSGSHRARCPASAARVSVAAVRSYSSDRDSHRQKQKMVVVGIPNPFIWFRTRIYYFLIRAYFDKEFTIDEFTEGAKQVCKNNF